MAVASTINNRTTLLGGCDAADATCPLDNVYLGNGNGNDNFYTKGRKPLLLCYLIYLA